MTNESKAPIDTQIMDEWGGGISLVFFFSLFPIIFLVEYYEADWFWYTAGPLWLMGMGMVIGNLVDFIRGKLHDRRNNKISS